MEPSLTGLRVLRAIAERGSFTAAARDLGHTQSAESRQVAALEREAGSALFERRVGGVRLTKEGPILLRHARVILDEIASAERELEGEDPRIQEVRLGAFVSAGAVLLPRTLQILRDLRPDIRVVTREGTTPAIVRAHSEGLADQTAAGRRRLWADDRAAEPVFSPSRRGSGPSCRGCDARRTAAGARRPAAGQAKSCRRRCHRRPTEWIARRRPSCSTTRGTGDR
jgi:DNA-binding transcriptional LysR family regulator